MSYDHLFVGAPRGASCPKTVLLITEKLKRLGNLQGHRLLDVGCGDGAFTRVLSMGFSECHGIDVQDDYLEEFKAQTIAEPKNKFTIQKMDAAKMSFPNAFFDVVVSIETLEHVPNLEASAKEIVRVLKPGGQLLITVPNRWFPFENHGAKIGPFKMGRVPLLPYFRFLHRRFSLARVFTLRDLRNLLEPLGLTLRGVDYAWPTFEHRGNTLQPILRLFFPLMRKMENSPLRFLGSSVITRFERPA
jgi:SAM-dependent methyltransferase